MIHSLRFLHDVPPRSLSQFQLGSSHNIPWVADWTNPGPKELLHCWRASPPNRVAGDTSITARDAQHESILGGGLKIALRRCSVFNCDLDGLARGDLFQAAPIRFLHGPQRWVGYQREQRTEQRHVPNSFHDFHLGSPYTRVCGPLDGPQATRNDFVPKW